MTQPDTIPHTRESEVHDIDDSGAFHPTYFFLYGSLMDPAQLRKVLRDIDWPTLHPVSIVGWKIMMWGQYPALVVKPGNMVEGVALKITKQSHIDLLRQYETEAYKVVGCCLNFKSGNEVDGRTFVFDGEMSALKEGTFDLKDWQMDHLEETLLQESSRS